MSLGNLRPCRNIDFCQNSGYPKKVCFFCEKNLHFRKPSKNEIIIKKLIPSITISQIYLRRGGRDPGL